MSIGTPCFGQAQANDDLARQGRFHQPPPPSPVQALPVASPEQFGNNNQVANADTQRRRPWGDLVDSLLDMMASRTMIVAAITDDPQTTGFGNSDFVEPIFDPSKRSPVKARTASQQNPKE